MAIKHGILLCAGPSLASYRPQPAGRPAMVVAVNRAALLQPCDVWACGDWPLIQEIRGAVAAFQIRDGHALPKLFTAANSHAWLRDHSTEWGDGSGRDVDEMESLYDGHEHELRWTCFTATAALWYCFVHSVRRLDVFGADWGGMQYCDGSPISQNRQDLKAASWELEIGIWMHLVKIVGERGMTVERHSPQSKEP